MKRIEAIRRDRAIQRKAVLDRALDRLSDIAEPLGVELVPFGSYAKGRVCGKSDLDLAIPGVLSEETRRQLEKEAERVEVDEGVPIDLMFEPEIPAYFRELRDTLSVLGSSTRTARKGRLPHSDRQPQSPSDGNAMSAASPESYSLKTDEKLDRIVHDINRGKIYLDELNAKENYVIEEDTVPAPQIMALAQIVHNLYNGVEDILEDIAKITDNFDPRSESSHSDLVNLMATKTSLRPAVLSPELHSIMDDFRKFRHVVRHSYGDLLIEKKVVEKFDTFHRIFWPRFFESLMPVLAHVEEMSKPDAERNPKDPG